MVIARPTSSSDYTVRIENFGPIAEATVDLRPLTVLIGPSNTGKSYLAGLLYALHRSLDTPYGLRRNQFLRVPRDIRIPRSQNLSEELKHDIQNWISTCSKLKEGDGAPPIPDRAVGEMKHILQSFQGFSEALVSQVARCFGVDDPEVLTRSGSGSRAPKLELSIPVNGNEHTHFQTSLKSEQRKSRTELRVREINLSVSEIHRLVDDLSFMIMDDEEMPTRHEPGPSEILDQLVEHVFLKAFAPLIRARAYYLPADRTGIMHSHHVVVSTLVQRASLAGIRRFDDVPMLSGVMADFLDILVSQISQMERYPQKSTSLREVARGVERRILDGKVEVNRGEIQYPSFAYRPTGWKKNLPLMLASSMVSELAPIVLYLRHVVRKNDILIIEEPESHLHPSTQAAFARELVHIINAGVRVVITTHSEWILEQLGNLVKASELPPDTREDEEVVLQPEDVGAWLFKHKGTSRSSVVKEIKIDAETGLYPTDYEEVSDALYNESAKIYNALQAGASG